MYIRAVLNGLHVLRRKEDMKLGGGGDGGDRRRTGGRGGGLVQTLNACMKFSINK